MTDPQQVDRAARALGRAIAPGPDDLAHPDYEDVVAFAEGRLGDVDREVVESHVALCATCAEDVRDVRDMRDAMVVAPRATPNTWKYVTAAAVAAAAILVIAVTIKRPATEIADEKTPVASASPREQILSTDEQAAVDAAIAAGRVDVPAAARELIGTVGQLLGPESSAPAMLPLSPAGTFVAEALPKFAWRPMPGAVSYSVAVFDASFREVASSGLVKSASWTPAAAMPKGVPLAWQVMARMADGSTVLAPAPPRPEARFTVLDDASAAKIAELRSRLVNRPIELGILLAKAGLLDDASREFARAAEQPATAEIAGRLQKSLKK